MDKNKKTFSIHPELFERTQKILQEKFSLYLSDENFADSKACKKIAQSILRLSDFYTQDTKGRQRATPWPEDWCQIAYLSYYNFLNHLNYF